MSTGCPFLRYCGTALILFGALCLPAPVIAAENPTPEIGIAVRDITPELPIRLAGYAGRKRPADKLDHPLVVQALALKNPSGERFVFVVLDNCEVSGAFMQPVLQQLADRFQLGRGAVAVVSSHTHSATVLTAMTPEEKARQQINAMFVASGGAVPTKDKIHLSAARGVAICEPSFATDRPTIVEFELE